MAFGHLDGTVISDVSGWLSIADLNAAGNRCHPAFCR